MKLCQGCLYPGCNGCGGSVRHVLGNAAPQGLPVDIQSEGGYTIADPAVNIISFGMVINELGG